MLSVVAIVATGVSCQRTPPPQGETAPPLRDAHDLASANLELGDATDSARADNGGVAFDGALADAADAADAAAANVLALSDPMSSHQETKADLLALFSIKDFTDQEKRRIQPGRFLERTIGSDGPGHMSQGNKAIASHLISREKCLEGLRGIAIQTPEQRATCGAENMVPVWSKGKNAWFCIDVFEFPNKACELPFVWTPPASAKRVCELQGKRLCSDIEWNMACRGDPEGGEDWRYAYGAKLDLSICNEDKGHIRQCLVRDAQTAWSTCATETEPSGAFPRCRSRFGVFDQHGNVAEVMMRREGDQVFTQLKGSAWFYNELAKEPNAPTPDTTPNKQGAYPDHCNFDPRWHVEPLERGHHVNYHLGFRCCKSIP